MTNVYFSRFFIPRVLQYTYVMRSKTLSIHMLALAIGALSLPGCNVLGYDHREKIAHSTLYNEKGALDEKAFAGALFAKFAQDNSPPTALVTFVESLGGECSTNVKDKDALYCTIPQSGSFCVASHIALNIATNKGAITNISAKSYLEGC